MLEVRGRLPDGSTGFLTLSDGVLILSGERGFINRRRVRLARLPSSAVTSTQLSGGNPPYRRMYRLAVGYAGEDGGGEVVLFSDDLRSLKAVKDGIDDEVERIRAAQEAERRERRRIRETHVRRLTLMLELLNGVFQILFGLDGRVNWGLMDERRSSIEELVEAMEEIDGNGAIAIGGLSGAIRRRSADEIKRECYALIEAVHRSARGLRSEGGGGVFNMELYELFVGAHLLLWDLRLGEYLGEELQEGELEELMGYLERLDDAVGFEGDHGFEDVAKRRLSEAGLNLSEVRSLLRRYLDHLVD
ncbi:MAG: hypothetical protein ACE5OO_04905 [Candidatus Bathyarchaeia archaeon]